MISSDDYITDDPERISELLFKRCQDCGISNPQIYVSCEDMIVVDVKNNDGGNVLFLGLEDKGPDEIELGNIFVGPKKQGWGGFGFQLALGVASARGKSCVIIPETIKNGRRFFSLAFGALPNIGAKQKDHFGEQLHQTFALFQTLLGPILDKSGRHELAGLTYISKPAPFQAYRRLSQSNVRVGKRKLFDEMADCLPPFSSLVLLLGEETTRAVIQQHVPVPPFRGVPGKYSYMSRELKAAELGPSLSPGLS